MSAIREHLGKASGAVSFVELVKGLEMPPVTVLIGVLLGGFRVEQRGGFYEGLLSVQIKNPQG